jgi:SpoVK/Ycf46/Vps4 family AAA+-type ATPase
MMFANRRSHSYGSTNGLSNFVVIGTTNRPGDVDVSLRAAHRLGKEIVFPASTTTDREQ